MKPLRYKRIGVDLDDILSETGRVVRRALYERYGIEFTLEDATQWHWIRITPKLSHLTQEERERLDDEVWTNPKVLKKARPAPGSLRTLTNLRDLGARLSFITSRDPKLVNVTQEWFSKWLPWVGREQIFIRANRQNPENLSILEGREFKLVVARQEAIEVLIEDDPDVALRAAQEVGVDVLLKRAPYNRNLRRELKTKPDGRVKVIFDWKQIHQELGLASHNI